MLYTRGQTPIKIYNLFNLNLLRDLNDSKIALISKFIEADHLLLRIICELRKNNRTIFFEQKITKETKVNS